MSIRKPSSRRQAAAARSTEKPEGLNLIPIMAIMVILIPMLIYMFNYQALAVHRVMAPRRGSGAKPAVEPKTKPLNLTVIVHRDRGFSITWEESLYTETQRVPAIGLAQAPDRFCDAEGGSTSQGCRYRPDGCFCYDYANLYSTLVQLKERFGAAPDAASPERINLTADPDVSWAVISRTMDASSCKLEEPSYSDLASYSAAAPRAGVWQCIRGGKTQAFEGSPPPNACEGGTLRRACEGLFPQVVFAML